MKPASPLNFVFPASFSVDAFIHHLMQSFPLHEQAETTCQRTYYDSFDWRLYARGYTLSIETSNGERWLNLHQEKGYVSQQRLPGHPPPRFVWELPDGPIRTKLAPLLDMRALLPLTEIHSRYWHLKWLNKDGKTVLRITIEQNQTVDNGGNVHPLPGRVRIRPVKGYRKAEKRIRHALHNNPALSPERDQLLLHALTVLGRKPLDYSAKLSLRLEPTMRSDMAGQLILRQLLATMKANEAGLRADIDSEFLHDFRVAVRRTRTALSQFRKIYPSRVIERFGPEFAWLGRTTGPTRDLDVFLLNFQHYRASLPLDMRDALDPFHSFLQKRQKQVHGQLVRTLDSDRYQRLMADWQDFLTKPLPEHPTSPHALVPAESLARRRIWRVYRRILKEGRAITPESPAEALHDLRKQCKKLRYLMEFFQSLFPQGQVKQLIRILKGLQDNLGEFQDTEVQQQRLRDFSQEMIDTGVGAETLLAMGILIQNLEQRRHDAREAFAQCFSRFGSRQHRKLFKTMFYDPQPEDDTS